MLTVGAGVVLVLVMGRCAHVTLSIASLNVTVFTVGHTTR